MVVVSPRVIRLYSKSLSLEQGEEGWKTLDRWDYHIHTSEGRRLFPRLPSLLGVCQRFYREIKPIYFQDNVFVATNSFLHHANNIKVFRKMAGASATSIRTMRVSREILTDKREPGNHALVRFEVKMSGNKIEIKGRAGEIHGIDNTISQRDKFCECELKAMAQKVGSEGPGILEFLEEYAVATVYNEQMRREVLLECPKCGTMRTDREQKA